MNFDIPTAMLLTALTTLVIGAGMAFAGSAYPRALQQSMRLWVNGLLIQSIPYLLFALRERIPEVLSIVSANSLLIIGIAFQIQALRRFNRQPDRRLVFASLIVLSVMGGSVLTLIWPSLHARVALHSVIVAILCGYGVAAVYGTRDEISRAGHLLAASLWIIIALMVVRVVIPPDWSMQDLTSSSVIHGLVFSCTVLMPILLTSTFMLLCGERLNADIRRLAMVDPLTGAYHRRTMSELAQVAVAEAKQKARPLSLLTLDIDDFKQLIDEFGHDAGDLALCTVVDVMQNVLRPADLLARLRGEEFAVLMPEINEADAQERAESIRSQIEDSGFSAAGWPAPLRVSIGVCALGGDLNDFDSMLREASRALRIAKYAGSNRVVAASQITEMIDDLRDELPNVVSGAA
jgi:diguanylate cyclase (GGDEF)-like protein